MLGNQKEISENAKFYTNLIVNKINKINFSKPHQSHKI